MNSLCCGGQQSNTQSPQISGCFMQHELSYESFFRFKLFAKSLQSALSLEVAIGD